MHNYPQNDTFLYHNLKLHKVIEMYLKYDNMQKNKIFNALISINNHLNSCTNCMLLGSGEGVQLYLEKNLSLDDHW